MTPLPPVLHMADVTKLLGLPTEEAARKFIARHGIPHSRLGKRTFVLLESLVAYLKLKEAVAAEEPKRGGAIHLATAAKTISRRPRVDLKSAADRLVGRVAEIPDNK